MKERERERESRGKSSLKKRLAREWLDGKCALDKQNEPDSQKAADRLQHSAELPDESGEYAESRVSKANAERGDLRERFFGLFRGVSGRRILCAAACFILALIVGAAEAFPGTYPFGIALAAAAGGVLTAAACYAGAVISSAYIPVSGGVYAVLLTLLMILRIASSVWLGAGEVKFGEKSIKGDSDNKDGGDKTIFSRSARALRRMKAALSNYDGIMLRENIRVRLALSALTALFAGAWSVVAGGYEFYDLFGAVFSILMTPAVTYLIYAASSRNMRHSPIREIGVYFCAAVITLSLSEISRRTGDGGGFNFGVMFAYAASSLVSLEYGIHRGVIMGLACGMALDPVYIPVYALSAAACGALGSYSPTFAILAGGGAGIAWAVYSTGFAAMSNIFAPVVVTCAVITPLYRFGFVKLPPKMFAASSASFAREAEDVWVDRLSLSDIKDRIGRMCDGMMSVSAVLSGMSEKLSRPDRTQMLEVCENSFEMHCHNCTMRKKCREKSAERIEKLKGDMASSLAKDGYVSASEIPSNIASMCYNIGRILDDVNLRAGEIIADKKRGDRLSVCADDFMLAGELLRRTGKEGAKLSEPDRALSLKLKRILSYNNLYAGCVAVYGGRVKHIFIGDIDLTSVRLGGDDIKKLCEDILKIHLSAPEFEISGASVSMKMHSVYSVSCDSGKATLAASSVHKYYSGLRSCGADCREACANSADAEKRIFADVTDEIPPEVSGDTMTSFEADGKYYMILSDGMGSGREAALTSGICAGLLERLIRSGAELESSLKMMNNIIRNSGWECSATVDIAEIDLVTGCAKFVKSGASPSFVLRDGCIFRLQSKTIPIGIIRALDAEMIKFDLRAGDTIVMVSDGVARSYEEAPWLLDMMSADHAVLFSSPGEAAEKIAAEAARRGSSDDISAGIIRIKSA